MEKQFPWLMGRGEPFGPVAETAREGEAEAPAWAERPSCPAADLVR